MNKVRESTYLAVSLFLMGLLCLGAHGGWTVAVDEYPPLLPPAGREVDGRAPFTFAVVGDTRGNMTVFEAALDGAQRSGAEVVLHTGDIAQRLTERQYGWLLQELHGARMDGLFCPVPGNHDIGRGGRRERTESLYRSAFGPPRYWFGYANTLFVGVDTSDEQMTREDLRWLREVLSQHRSDFEACIIFTHVPPHDPRPGKGRELGKGKERMVRLLQKHNVSAIMAGHIHGQAEGTVGGIPIYVHGGAGEELQRGETHHTYLTATVNDTGEVDVSVRRIERMESREVLEYLLWVKFPWTVITAAGGLFIAGGFFCLGTRPLA